MHPRRVKIIFQAAFALFIAVGILDFAGGVSQGQSSSWSTPTPLSSLDTYSWFPDIVADPHGNLHVVWASGFPGFDAVIYTTSLSGINWSTPNDIFANPQVGTNSGATRPSLLVDRKDNLNITFIDPNTVFYSRAQLWNASDALAWLPRAPVSGDQTSYFSKLAIDSKDHLHLVYTENLISTACSNCYHIYYRNSEDGGITWSEPIDITERGEGSAKPQILVDKKDNIHVVWETGEGGGLGQLSNPTAVSYAASYDGGKTWADPITFPIKEDEIAKNITIGLDRKNQLVVAWWLLPADLIMYQVSDDYGKSWSDQLPIPGVWGAGEVYQSNLDDYSMANDSLGNLHLAAVARVTQEQKVLDIVDLVWNGSEWMSPDVITTYEGDVPEWPRIAVNKGNQLNVVWFVRDEAHIWESDKGHYRVWYSNGLAEAPSIPIEIMPTMTPTTTFSPAGVTITATESADNPAEVTPEPTSNLADQTPPVSVPVSETDYIPLLAKALFPSLLFVIGIVVVAFIRRR